MFPYDIGSKYYDEAPCQFLFNFGIEFGSNFESLVNLFVSLGDLNVYHESLFLDVALEHSQIAALAFHRAPPTHIDVWVRLLCAPWPKKLKETNQITVM